MSYVLTTSGVIHKGRPANGPGNRVVTACNGRTQVGSDLGGIPSRGGKTNDRQCKRCFR